MESVMQGVINGVLTKGIQPYWLRKRGLETKRPNDTAAYILAHKDECAEVPYNHEGYKSPFVGVEQYANGGETVSFDAPSEESDDDMRARLRQKFSVYRKMAQSVID